MSLARRSSVVGTLLLLVVVLAASPTDAQVVPSVAVSPSTDLVDGQLVDVEAAGFPPDTTLAVIECRNPASTSRDCDIDSADLHTSDATGSLSTGYTASRVIFTASDGRLDCAVDACALVVATLDEATAGFSPISFQDLPLPPLLVEVELEDPHYQEAPDFGGTTVRARLRCATSADVTLRFGLRQTNPSGGTTTGANIATVQCQDGAEAVVFSDLFLGFEAGATEASVFASIGMNVVDAVVAPVTILSNDEVVAVFEDRLASDPGAFAELLESLEWRVAHNPTFRQRFVQAILAAA